MERQHFNRIDHPDGAELIYDFALQFARELPDSLIFMEIGCWKGGTTTALQQAVRDSGKKDRWVWSVDPYGSKPFKLGMGIQEEADYNEDIYRDAMAAMSGYALANGINHHHWRMTSDDFFRILPQVQFYHHGAVINPKFGFVFIDGDHSPDTVERELNHLIPIMPSGMIALDDVPYITAEERPTVKRVIDGSMQDSFRAYWRVR